MLGKGTYLNGGNAIAVQRGLVVSQTLDAAEAAPSRATRMRSSSSSATS